MDGPLHRPAPAARARRLSRRRRRPRARAWAPGGPPPVVARADGPSRAVAPVARLRRPAPVGVSARGAAASSRAAVSIGGRRMTQSATGKPVGVASADQRRAMSGLDFVQGLVSGTVPLNSMAQTLGYDIVEASRGRVAIAAQPTAAHLNPAGTVHGGLSATLLDSCMGLAVQSTLEKGFSQTTLEFKISLVRPVTPDTGRVRAEGSVISRGRRIGTAEGRLTDSEGRLLAHGTTTCLIFEY